MKTIHLVLALAALVAFASPKTADAQSDCYWAYCWSFGYYDEGMGQVYGYSASAEYTGWFYLWAEAYVYDEYDNLAAYPSWPGEGYYYAESVVITTLTPGYYYIWGDHYYAYYWDEWDCWYDGGSWSDWIEVPAPPPPPPPTISGSNTVWWFNGETPSGYDTSITLTSSGGFDTTWTVTQGQGKINLIPNGAQATVDSTGTAFSSSVGDIGITATVGGQTSDVFWITSRKPASLFPLTPVYNCDNNYGYETQIWYVIQDQLNAALPGAVPINEDWPEVNPEPDYVGTDWERDSPQGGVSQPFYDKIQGERPGRTPTATCNAGDPTKVQHWGQEWYIGSTTAGAGVLVQTNTLQKYIGHAEHE